MKNIYDLSFRPFGRILPYDTTKFCKIMMARPTVPAPKMKGGTNTVYEASLPELEALSLFQELQEDFFGGLPAEFGHCSGWNQKLNALEYHRSSEVDIAVTNLILLLAPLQEIDPKSLTLSTSAVQSFLVPKGTAVELYATTLHFAPCGIAGREFRCGVALPRGTNEPIQPSQNAQGEERLFFARNKWLISHQEGRPAMRGAWVGLIGENISV